jgi:hypothetical protein
VRAGLLRFAEAGANCFGARVRHQPRRDDARALLQDVIGTF